MAEQPILHYALALLAASALVLAVCALLLTGVLLVNRRERKSGKGPFCGHCGVAMKNEPSGAVAFENLSLLDYQCARCQQRTLLPNDPVD